MLTKLHPTTGFICVAEQKEIGFKHHWCDNADHAERTIKTLDSAGKTVFVAQASFKTTDSRKGENALQMQNFFLDIDCGAGKPYATQRDGLTALGAFCKASGLPVPVVINSGNGLYAQWPLDRPVPAALWKGVAEIFKKVVLHHGFDTDPSRTADLASVLRPVGATHRKDALNPKTVTLLRDCEPLSTVDLIGRIKTAFEATGEKLAMPKASPTGLSASILGGLNESRPSSAKQIAAKCAQIAEIESSKGDVSEPLWYAAIGLLRHTTEAPEIIHDWSKGHPDYDEALTERKIEQHRAAAVGPTTCTKFATENPQGCKGCRYAGTITSPIVLGYPAPTPLARDTPDTEYPEPPGGFLLSASGVYYKSDGEHELLYPYPLWVSCINSDHFGESVTIRHLLPHDGWREVTIASNRLCEPKSFFSVLIDDHIHIVGKERKGLFMAYIETFMEKLRKDQKLSKLSGQMGWRVQDDELSFVHGAEIYMASGEVHKVGYSVSAPGFVQGMKPVGDPAQSMANTSILNREGLEGLAFAYLCTAFGAPLVRFTGYEGAMVSIVGDSGLGKTLIGKWGLSAWGDPKKLLLMRDDTSNALVGRLGVYGSLPAYIDEVSNITPEVLSELAYRITQGREKARLTRSAQERTNINQWNTLAVVSSNHSLVDKLAAHKGDAGAEINRIFEYEITEGITKEEGQAIADELESYGDVGKRYAQYLTQNQHKHSEAIRKIAEVINDRSGAETSERFWSMVGAVGIYGGMIAKSIGVSNVDATKLIPWVVHTLKDMRKYKQIQTFDVISFLGALLDKYSNCVLVVAKYDSKAAFDQLGYKEPRGRLVARIEMDSMKLWISYDVIKTELARLHISGRKLATMLNSQGVAVANTAARVSLGRGTIHSGIAQYCWQFDLNNPSLGHKALAMVKKLAVEEGINEGRNL